ncbi:MAG: mechanosensitive ion channel [Alteromonadaceae bacterium]|nr:mechanosensitive ion channel [Alteromonadaceae bacterium]
MFEVIKQWLSDQGVAENLLSITSMLISSGIILLISGISYYLVKRKALVTIKKVILNSKNQWDDLLLKHEVFSRITLLIPFLFLLFLTPLLLPSKHIFTSFLLIFAKVAISFHVAHCISAMLNVSKSVYKEQAKERYLPLNSTIGIVKLAIYLVAIILSISFILEKSPVYLLSGLGALTAVLLLIFQDTIKGLVASIQISANRLVAPGDWIELPQYGADGDVIEIGLNMVKIRNFDRTVTTVPTYALISGSFKNWRDMYNSGGRRIKRSIIIDIGCIGFYDQDKIKQLNEIKLLQKYLSDKQQEISLSCQNLDGTTPDNINTHQLTNIGTFRAYIEAYLKQHKNVHHKMTCMVRQLSATATGLPLELYFFSNDQDWVNYEAIQADIFDHLFAMASYFDIRIFQHPSGHDWKN